MGRSRKLASTVFVVLFCAAPMHASAQIAPPATADWAWPIFESVRPETIEGGFIKTSLARPAVWTTNGEYQNFGDPRFEGSDPHPGIDIRAAAGDVAFFPEGGELIDVQNLSHCESATTGDKCRMFVRTPGGLVYYIGHFSYGATPDGSVGREDMEKLINAFTGMGPAPVSKGKQAGVVRAYASPPNWDHLHMSVFDPARAYDQLNPLAYLNRHTVSMTNAVLDIVDDERPLLGDLEFIEESGTVNETGVCGVELKGAVDIAADIKDTFYTSRPKPNAFPGSDTKHSTVGIYGARYLVRSISSPDVVEDGQWYRSPASCEGFDCGLWRMRFPSADRTSNLIVANDDDSLIDYLSGGPPYAAAGEVGPALWVMDRTDQDHASTAPFAFIHQLTNGVTENSVEGVNGSWDTSSLEDGRYIVTVEAWDYDGNRNARSTHVTVNNDGTAGSATGPNFAQVYVRDHDDDVGQIPSSVGDAPFWESPDIIIVPESETPDVDVRATSFPLVVGETYRVYVRAHNHGCVDVADVRASVYTGTPGPVFSNLRAISPEGEWGGTAVTVPAQGSALIGPFSWTVTSADLDGASEGHRCFLAAIHSGTDHGPSVDAPADWKVVNDDNVAQRNIQTTLLRYSIKNPTISAFDTHLEIELFGFPDGGTFSLLVEEADQLESAFSYPTDNGFYVIDVPTQELTTPSWSIPAGTDLASEVRFTLPAGASGRAVVTQYSGTTPMGGMTFYLSGPPIVK